MTIPSDNTAFAIISDAYREACINAEGVVPNGEQLAVGMRYLNQMVELWQTQGLKLWLLSDTTVTLVSGQALYTLSPTGDVVMEKPHKVVDAYYADSAGNRTPVEIIAWQDYLQLSPESGSITSIHVDKQATSLKIRTWLTPDAQAAAGSLHLLLQTKATRATKFTDSLAFPSEWAIALRWGLADELCTGQPEAIVQRCAARAQAYRSALEDFDVEDTSMSFNVEGYFNSSFT